LARKNKEKIEYHLKNLDPKLWKDFNTATIINQTTMKAVILDAVKRYVKRNQESIDRIKKEL